MFFTERSEVKKFIAPTHREIDVHNQNKFIKRKTNNDTRANITNEKRFRKSRKS